MACENISVVDSGFIDIPNVVVDEQDGGMVICSSSKWSSIGDLPDLFVGIMSHESIHLTLLKVDGESSDFLDNVGSLSTVTRSLRNIGVVGEYPEGMIGLDRVFEKEEEGDTS